ncbi:MAG: DUF2208 family protein [Pyrobaculum sp.]
MRRVLISILSIVAFSAILTFFPGEYFTAIILYFLLFFGVSIAMGLRSYRKGVAAAQEVSKGKPLLEIDEKEVMKLMEKDKELIDEYKKVSRLSLMPLITLPIFIMLATVLFPTLPSLAQSTLGSYIGGTTARFLSYVAIFGIFSAISMATFKPPVFPRIVRQVRIYESGIVLDKSIGLKAPVSVESYKVNAERKFVEFKLNNQIFRIYYKDVKELDTILSKIIRPLEQGSQ